MPLLITVPLTRSGEPTESVNTLGKYEADTTLVAEGPMGQGCSSEGCRE